MLHKIAQIFAGVYVNHKTVIIVLDFLIVENVINQLGFADATRRNKRNIVLIEQQLSDCCSFFNTVAEVFRPRITVCYKRILHNRSFLQIYKNILIVIK